MKLKITPHQNHCKNCSLIQYQILQSNISRNVWYTERKITTQRKIINEILGVNVCLNLSLLSLVSLPLRAHTFLCNLLRLFSVIFSHNTQICDKPIRSLTYILVYYNIKSLIWNDMISSFSYRVKLYSKINWTEVEPQKKNTESLKLRIKQCSQS